MTNEIFLMVRNERGSKLYNPFPACLYNSLILNNSRADSRLNHPLNNRYSIPEYHYSNVPGIFPKASSISPAISKGIPTTTSSSAYPVCFRDPLHPMDIPGFPCMGYAVQSLHIEAMPPVFISTGSPRAQVYAWMSLMARSGFRKRMRISKLQSWYGVILIEPVLFSSL